MGTKLTFKDGTLLLDEPLDTTIPCKEWGRFDARVRQWRAPAGKYHDIFAWFYRSHTPLEDYARAYLPLDFRLPSDRTPRDYQTAALNAWTNAGRRGVIVLPTGAGKTFVAEMCIANAKRSTIVVVPTIDLMTQWATRLEQSSGLPVGMLGGGSKDVQALTVATYDSALLTMEFIGNKFGLLIVDECHHLPGNSYQQIANSCIAPYRLGLSATPEREDGADALLDEILGPICYRKEIGELERTVLAPYQTERLFLSLEPDEQQEYDQARQTYINFVHQNRIALGSPEGWGLFLRACSRRPHGKEALQAYFAQKRIALSARQKLRKLQELLHQHRDGRIIVFTADNATAYKIGEQFLLPVLTHHTKAGERKGFLDAFRNGEYPCIVTSKVLNEGVDVPEANVGIVVSGSGSKREHIQRLGRILRASPGKSAILYELVTIGTSEANISDRRRQNSAYERPDFL